MKLLNLITSLIVACLTLSAGAVATERTPEPPAHAVVLMYHHFGVDQYPSTNTRLDQFEAHLDYLEQHDFHVWPLKKIITALDRQQALPDRTVAITIDDAYISVYTEAWPRLRQRGWPFTVFVASDAIDKGLPAYMSWQQLRELQAQGVTIANHSHSHDYLVQRPAGETQQQWRQRIIRDIKTAQQRLTQELGAEPAQAPRLFAYPYGEYTLALAKILHELGYTAFGQQSGAIGAASDRQTLPRYPMAEDYAAMDSFITKVNSLPLVLRNIAPSEPLTTERQPILTLTLADNDIEQQQLSCYVSGQGRTEITWLDSVAGRFSIQAQQPLAIGRQRYNCTAPATNSQRYYWFSQPWIITE